MHLHPFLAALALVTTTLFAAASHAQMPTSESVPVSNIQFLDKTYHLAWRSDPAPNYSKTEYLPDGEKLPYYHNMLLVAQVSGISVTDAMRVQVESLKNTKDTRIMHLIENPGSGEVLLVFALSAPDEQHEVIWEWNAYRYSPVQASNGEQAVRLFGYSKRHYGNDESVYDFLENLDVDNPGSEAITAVAKAQIP